LLRPSPDALLRRKYTALLPILLVGLVIQTTGVTLPAFKYVLDGLATVLAIAIFVVVFGRGRRRGRIAAAALLLALLALGWARSLAGPAPPAALSIAYQSASAAFYWLAVGAILRDLFRHPPLGAENVRGSICGYLIAGAAWGSVNALAWLLAPATFGVDPHIAAMLDEATTRQSLFTYYSFAQMMTIGYADVTPLRAPATTLSLLAALFGVFYTAVVVSQLVAVARVPPDRTPGDH